MYKVMVTGAGKIGSLIACMLADCGDYEVHLADLEFAGTDVTRLLQAMPEIKTVGMDVRNQAAVEDYLCENKIDAVISSLPYFLNTHVALAAKNAASHYFDLTEDTTVTSAIQAIAENAETAFVPQCGLAPGFVSIAANSLIQLFEQPLHARLRVGALPERASNALQYSLTWSTDGLINEYANPCFAIENGEPITLKPLEDLETIQIDGSEYEAFNTSGGLGSLATLYQGKIKGLNYKTMRYPGHCEKMRFLMNSLKLNEDRETLKAILERAIPKTYQDLVIVYVTVEGISQGELIEKSYVNKIYPKVIRGLYWSAIQISTAASLCAVVDLVRDKPCRGLILQETFSLADILANRFGSHFA
ncbi:MAG: saccharopine dehydrogenase C-terminal domain-containing protein [Tatlockia sp.]|jgi:saccharopine dehydrogenase-like NADP-dependent oxidoreductase